MLIKPTSIEKLLERIQDPDEDVRYLAVKSICSVLIANPDNISNELLKVVCSRTIDKKDSIRVEALSGLTKVYCQLVESEGSKFSVSGNKYDILPSSIMQVYLIAEAKDKLNVDQQLQAIISGEPQTCADRFIQFFLAFTDHGRNAFYQYIKDKFA